MKTVMMKAADLYQCPSCIPGTNTSTCDKAKTDVGAHSGCRSHNPGARLDEAPYRYTGLPRGFSELGPRPTSEPLDVWQSYEEMVRALPNLLTKFSIPVLMYLDKHGNTISRWYSARTNFGWTAVILGDCRDKLTRAQEVTAQDIQSLDVTNAQALEGKAPLKKLTMLEAIKAYQCPGCLGGPNPIECDSAVITNKGCASHVPGTLMSGWGVFYLGLPKGFCRLGPNSAERLAVWESYESFEKSSPQMLTKFNVPVWKHLDENGNTLVRWFDTVKNVGKSVVILGDCRDKLPGALEISTDDIENMD